MADDVTKPKAKDDGATPDTTTAPETPSPEAASPEPAKVDSSFIPAADPLKNAAGVTEGPPTTPKPKRKPRPKKATKAASPEPASAEAEAEAPAEEAPAEEQAAAPPPEEKPKEEAAPAPATPVAETPEEKEKREKAEAAAKTQAPQQPQQPTADAKAPERITDEMLQGSQFVTNFNLKHMPLLNEIWGIGTVDPELVRALGQEGEIRKHKSGLLFDLPNGHTIEWHHNFGGAEFIGMPRANSKFDEDDAHAVVAASKSRGWQALNVFGSVQQKEMMWLEAQRQGIGVANFEPMPDSAVYQKWLKESQANIDQYTVGAAPAEQGLPVLPSKFTGLPPAADTEKPDAAAQTPDKQESKAEAPKDAAPADKGPQTPQGESSIEEFLDRRITATADPELKNGLLAMRDLLKKETTADAGQVKGLLGDEPTPASYTAAAKYLESHAGDAGKALPKVETPAPATITPPAAPVTAAPKTRGSKAPSPT